MASILLETARHKLNIALDEPPALDTSARSASALDVYSRYAERFKLLAHPERLRILDVLRRGPECVCHLEALLRKPQPYVSQQLRVLREAGVITDEKQGNNVYYRLCDPKLEAWLSASLGPVGEEDVELALLKTTIACPCPKCEGDGNGDGNGDGSEAEDSDQR